MPENPKRIHLLGSGRQEEARAAGVIKPGQLLELNVDGDVIPHDTPLGDAERAFALEDALQGRTIADDYASGELVSYVIANRGDVVYGWLTVGEVTTIGSFLCSDGSGNLMVRDESDVAIDLIAVALEAIDNSESGDNNARIRVRVL